MQKLENKTLQNFLERFIESIKHKKEYGYNDLFGNQLDIPFIISSLYQSFRNNPSDYIEFISDLEEYSDYGFSIENSRNDYNGIIDVYIYLSKDSSEFDLDNEEMPNYDYLLSFTYDSRYDGYCMCTPDMDDYREDNVVFSVRCNSCHARGGTASSDLPTVGILGDLENKRREIQNKAIQKWNVRK